jgi:iron complex transport system ATP-binding protein
MVRAAVGLLPLAAGRVGLDGQDIAAMRRDALARNVAYLPQGQTLHWPLSVERLVALGRLPHLAPFSRIGAGDRAAIEHAMTLADVTALAGRTATQLSGGERARVLLARALAVDAPILVADEPLAALDPEHQLQVMELLAAQAAAGRLVVAVLHDLGLAMRFCHRLLLISHGRLVDDGPPDAVLTPENLRKVYRVAAWTGEADGHRLIVPLHRTH